MGLINVVKMQIFKTVRCKEHLFFLSLVSEYLLW